MFTDSISMTNSQPPLAGRSLEPKAEGRLERAFFGHRWLVVLGCLALTLFFGLQLPKLSLNASFEKSLPSAHPFIRAFLQHRAELPGLGNSLRVVLEARQGTVLDHAYLETLRKLNDELFLTPGVERAFVKSLWTPATRWSAVTEQGFEGGPVMPPDYDGSTRSLQTLKTNLERSGEIGQLVAPNMASSVVFVPLVGGADGIDYAALNARLERLRTTYTTDKTNVRIVGYAKVVGDMLGGLRAMAGFFLVTLVVAAATLYAFTRCARSTALVLACSLVAVVWQLGLLPLFGAPLDPYSVLVPFLVFAIGMSHGAQKMNGIMQDIGRGASRLMAAKLTFRRLFMAGLMALLADAVGFAVLSSIEIQAIRELALMASVGVGALIITNLVLLPVLLSFVGVDQKAAERALRLETQPAGALVTLLVKFTSRGWALATVATAVVLLVVAFATSRHLAIGDLDAGAPELRTNSRYNEDAAWVNRSYSASSDIFAVMAVTGQGGCVLRDTQQRLDRLEWELRQVPGVIGTQSMAGVSRLTSVGLNEGELRWLDLPANQQVLNSAILHMPRELVSPRCAVAPVLAFLSDHRASTLDAVVHRAQKVSGELSTADVRLELAAGSAGIQAATNAVVHSQFLPMLLAVYAAVAVLCLIAFRSWRATVVAMIPLVLTGVLCEALMVMLGIGVKVATLPVVALGVGIGVDYALYVLSITLARLRCGACLSEAYADALRFTGRVVLLTGATLAIGVAAWIASPIKFQADMGLLLTFMFLWNMAGALVLVPALARIFLVAPASHQSQ